MKILLLALAAVLAAVSASAPHALAQSNPPLAAAATAPPAPEFVVSADTDAIRFDVHAAALVEALQDDEVVFDSGTVDGGSFVWDMKDGTGQRVADGSYVTSIAARDGAGETTRQDGVIAVASADPSGAEVTTNTSGTGTVGKIPKWTAAGGVLGNSIMTELTKRIGINAANPIATLHIAGPLPANNAGAGINAVPLLSTSGGKGGATTGTTKPAGGGAAIQLIAGNGGNAPGGGINGNGGNVVLKPGVAGTGGATAGATGKVLLAPDNNGNVGVGTFLPTSKLTVVGRIETQNSPNSSDGGIRYPDGTVQRTAKAPDAEKLDGIDSSGFVKKATSGGGAVSFGSIAANHCVDLTFGISGILPGDFVIVRVAPDATLPDGLTFNELNVPSASTLKVRVCNGNSTPSDQANSIGIVYYAIRP